MKQATWLECFVPKERLPILPTGYGKSLVYQILPHVLKERDSKSLSVVLVVSPLSVLMQAQIVKLRARGVETAVLAVKELADNSGYTAIYTIVEWCATKDYQARKAMKLCFATPKHFFRATRG